MTLDELKPGQRAIIEAIDPAQPGMVRLMVLGLTEGARLKLEATAIGGDPLELDVHGTTVSVRREQARSIDIIPGGTDD